ncbi:hypothetical protein [Microbacterium sp. NPDC076895]|uniref:hypothetical protein n=1 Tax=Microbacterium sp. NPDC076895 TaxID=3154957 RepID=UPI0034370642
MATQDRKEATLSDDALIRAFPTKYLPAPKLRELPAAPHRRQQWRFVGPGIVAAGVGMASGEFILFPYIASQVGLAVLTIQQQIVNLLN